MKSYLSLVPICAHVHKRQSRMTRICIILAVFLVTSIFSMADMLIRAEITAMIQKHGDWHIALQNVPEDVAKQIRTRNDIAAFSWYDAINPEGEKDYYINGKKAVLFGVEETYLTDIRNYPTEGSYPRNNKEIALSTDAKELFEIRAGDNITVHTPAGDFNYTISGFYEDDSEFNEMIDGICVYMNRTTFNKIRGLVGEDSNSEYYIQLQEDVSLKKSIADIKEQYNLASENIDENTAVLGLRGASSNETAKNMYSLAAVCFVIILFAGILMISGCMNSNVAQRTKFFGMMRCIGASKQQIIRFVRTEALNWCKIAIPTGCLLGVVICWILCAVLRFLVKGEWAQIPLFGVSIVGMICGVAVGIITVFIAAHSPAKQAAKVSPVAAVSGNAEVSENVGHAANTGLFKVETSLGIHHAVSSKKNLALMIGSFSLTIILFLAFSACLDIVNKLVPSDSNFSPDLAIASRDNGNSIERNLVEKLSKIPGISAAFGTMMSSGISAEINGKPETIDLVSYDKYMLDNSKKSIVSGELSKVYGDTGYVLVIFNQDSRLDVGDQIKISDQKLEVGAVASEGIGGSNGAATVVCSEETFTRLTGERAYIMINMIMEKDAPKKAVDEVRNLAGENSFVDRREEEQDVYNSYWVFRLAAYGFLAIISFITVLNIMNSISMGVSARIRQYGAMRAVGMESRQVTRMITAEAATYAACGTIIGIILGLLLHYLIYAKLLISHFGGTWIIPVTTIGIILLLVLASCIMAVYAPAKRMRNMAITDTINDM